MYPTWRKNLERSGTAQQNTPNAVLPWPKHTGTFARMGRIFWPLLVVGCLAGSTLAKGQAVPRYNAALLDTLQHLHLQGGRSAAFAHLYYKAIEITNHHAHGKPADVQQFIFRFEDAFGPLFFAACRQPQASTPWWQAYFDTTRPYTLLQQQAIGMNAHINGDMWLALVQAHPYDSLRRHHRELMGFQKAFNVFFDSMHQQLLYLPRVRTLHTLTLGLDKPYGRALIRRWRHRQVRLALLHYSHPRRHARKLERVHTRLYRFNRQVEKWLG